MRLPNAEVLQHTHRYLELVAGRKMSTEEKQAFITETVDSYERYYNRGFISYRKAVTQAGQFAALEWSGKGAILHDLLGREYIDCLGGYGIFSAGVNHPKIVKAVTDQLGRMALNSQELLEPWRAALAKVLAEVTPGDLQNSFFINNGTDAIEGAIKLARLYTKRHTFISTLGGFHGKSMGSLSLMGKASFREPFQSGLQDVRFVPYGDAGALEDELQRCDAVGTHIAGVVLEPVQGEAGGVVPPDDYLPRARAACTKYGALLIADEIQTGMGRTGKFLACEHEGVVPDGVALGKALGGGMLPVSAFVATNEVMQVFRPGDHGSTFGGNPLAATVALEALAVLYDERLIERSGELGAYLLAQLQTIKSPLIREIRGRGLFVGLEVDARRTDARAIVDRLLARGVLSKDTHGTVVRFAPPLTITREEIDWAVEHVRAVFAELGNGMRRAA